MSTRKTVLAGLFVLALGVPAAQGQIMLGGGQGAAYSWPRYRAYRDFAGPSYVDNTPTGRQGYFVSLGIPGYDDIGNGPSMAYSPIFNAPRAPAQARSARDQSPARIFPSVDGPLTA